jgi:SAM-dependent methyltransferase
MTTNTERSFRDKWENNRTAAFASTLEEGSDINRWILGRNGFVSSEDLASYLKSRSRILDAGCGNGRVTALLRKYAPVMTEIVGIDLVAAEIARENLAGAENVRFEQRNLMENLSSLGRFDFIYCQEVLHHTPDPVRGFNNLAALLLPGGELAVYVYKQKAPVREFVDDYIRDRIADMPYEKAREISAQITELGRVLAESGGKVVVGALPILGIEAGEYDVQRLLYHFFMKCYWNPQLSVEENIAINYDWYHPQLCSRHTLPEVAKWFRDAGLEIVHEHVDYYGITVRGRLAE